MALLRSNLFLVLLVLAAARQLRADSLDEWTVVASGTGMNLYGIAYGSGRFVAVGQSGTTLVATNPGTWNPGTNSASGSLYGVAWGNNQFVAVGDNGTILTSADGSEWTTQTSPTTNSLKAVRYIGEQFLALGANGTLLTSTDAVSWVKRDAHSTMTLQGVAFGNGTFCAVGGGPTQNSSILRSPDSVTWSNQTVGINYLYDVTFGNGVFVIQGIRGLVWISTDAVTWTQRQTGSFDYLFGATFAQGVFVAVGGPFSGGSQKIATSRDGANWKLRPVTTMLSPPLRGVAYGNGYFVAVGEKGLILRSGPVFGLAGGGLSPDGGIQWILSGESGRSYHFQYSDNLAGAGWADVTNFTSTAETSVLADPGAPLVPTRFYRATSP